MDLLLDALSDSLVDTAKPVPFLFVTYLAMEALEHGTTGLSERVVRDQHAARNAFLPVFTALIIGIPFAISGGIITETIFSWPGMGLTLLSAVQNEDIPMAMGALSFIGVLALLAHLVADIAYSFLDPRIRYQ